MSAKGGRPRSADPARSISISLPASLLAAVEAAPGERSAWIRQAIMFGLGVGPRPPAPPAPVVAPLRSTEQREVTPMFKKGVLA